MHSVVELENDTDKDWRIKWRRLDIKTTTHSVVELKNTGE